MANSTLNSSQSPGNVEASSTNLAAVTSGSTQPRKSFVLRRDAAAGLRVRTGLRAGATEGNNQPQQGLFGSPL
jgi:hypothetical protein